MKQLFKHLGLVLCAGVLLSRPIAYRPDIILMDINLSRMDEFGALQVLREEPVTAQIPAVALSASVFRVTSRGAWRPDSFAI
jgi:CheY-like chemotaxis protein